MRWGVIFYFLFLFDVSTASTLSGIVTGENGQPLPFCNIYEKNTLSGSASNETGYYELSLSPGEHIIVFQYIGYKRKEITVTINSTPVELNVNLEPDVIELNEVVINPGTEDPAYEIIRAAIEKRKQHKEEINAYSCEVYMKGLQKFREAPDKILGVELNTILDLDSNNTGIIYLSESVSNFYYQYPEKTKEIMVASKVSGNSNQFSWNDARSMQMDFYDNFIQFEGFSQRGFVSPIADNALMFYDYRLIGSFMQDGKFIYKIEVLPKRQTDPVFSGTIYILDNDFRIYSLELTTSKAQGLEFIDTFHVAQEFLKMPDDRWTVISNKFNFSYSIFGISGLGYFNAFYKNYNLDPQFEKNFFGNEISVITEGSNKQDSTFWDTTRPVPLTTEEVDDYSEKDSMELIKQSPEYKDSLDRIYNKFSAGDLLSGYHFRDSNKEIYINTSSLPELIQYNTVEGWVIHPVIRIDKTLKSKDRITIMPGIRYGFDLPGFNPTFLFTYRYNPFNFSAVTLTAGRSPIAVNPKGISPFVNSLYTIFLEENHLKLYERTYLSISHEKEILNGFTAYVGLEYAHREQLFNSDDISPIVDMGDQHFTSNNYPFYPDDSIFPPTSRLQVEFRFRYTPGQLYMTTPDGKFIIETKYPTITANFKGAYNYDFISLNVRDFIRLNLFGNLEYSIETGGFLRADTLQIEDYYHFAGNETWFSSTSGNGFMLLPYYYASGTSGYAEGHFQWHTEGFMFNKLPLFKQLKLQPVFSFNYLYTRETDHYSEFGAGIEHLFKFGRIDFAWTPNKFPNYPTERFKILIGIGF